MKYFLCLLLGHICEWNRDFWERDEGEVWCKRCHRYAPDGPLKPWRPKP
jgi:hypothetical protein